MISTQRALERALRVESGALACPRRGNIPVADCSACSFLCRTETEPASVICSYPIPAAETFPRRSHTEEGVALALRHRLERT